MTKQRIKELFEDYSKSLSRLEEGYQEDLSKGSIVIDGCIQRFEFTFELAWKLAKFILKYSGIEAGTPRIIIKEAFKAKLLENGDSWIDMLEDRNKTAHLYDEKEAKRIYLKVKEYHLENLRRFKTSTQKFIKDMG